MAVSKLNQGAYVDQNQGAWNESEAITGAVYPPPDIHSISSKSGNKNGMGNIDNVSTWNIKKFEFKENEKWQEQYSRPVRRQKSRLRHRHRIALFD